MADFEAYPTVGRHPNDTANGNPFTTTNGGDTPPMYDGDSAISITAGNNPDTNGNSNVNGNGNGNGNGTSGINTAPRITNLPLTASPKPLSPTHPPPVPAQHHHQASKETILRTQQQLEIATAALHDLRESHSFDAGILAGFEVLRDSFARRAAAFHVSAAERNIFRRERLRLEDYMAHARERAAASEREVERALARKERLVRQLEEARKGVDGV